MFEKMVERQYELLRRERLGKAAEPNNAPEISPTPVATPTSAPEDNAQAQSGEVSSRIQNMLNFQLREKKRKKKTERNRQRKKEKVMGGGGGKIIFKALLFVGLRSCYQFLRIFDNMYPRT